MEVTISPSTKSEFFIALNGPNLYKGEKLRVVSHGEKGMKFFALKLAALMQKHDSFIKARNRVLVHEPDFFELSNSQLESLAQEVFKHLQKKKILAPKEVKASLESLEIGETLDFGILGS